MRKTERLPAPRFEYWRNSKGEYNYRTIGINGRSIGGEQHQGFKRLAALRNNISAHAAIFGCDITWNESGTECHTSAGVSIPLVKATK